MNREIKFRAKTREEAFSISFWVHGELHQNCRIPHIHNEFNQTYNIDTNTIGQYTGLKDKNGVEIYEGDIVLQQGYHGNKTPMVVKFECGAFIVGYHEGSSTKRKPMLLNSKCEVIGNIYDNKELLED